MDIVSCLMLVGNKVLLLVMEELELFHSFSGWMRFEIDRLASSSTNEDISEKETVMDHGKILAYIQNYMLSSSLGLYLSNVARDSREKDAVLADDDPSLLETLDKQIRNQEAGQLQPTVFPQIEFLCGYLAAKSSAVFDGLAEAEKRSVRFGQPVELNLGGRVSKLDVRVCASEDEVSRTTVPAFSRSLPPPFIPHPAAAPARPWLTFDPGRRPEKLDLHGYGSGWSRKQQSVLSPMEASR